MQTAVFRRPDFDTVGLLTIWVRGPRRIDPVHSTPEEVASERKPQCKLQQAWVGKRGRGRDLTEHRRTEAGVRLREVRGVGQVKRFCPEL